MGIRILAVYGMPLGLLLVDPMIALVGFAVSATIACAIGLLFTAVIALRWRGDLWSVSAPANAH